MDLVPPLGIEIRKINPNGTVPKKEHGTMNTKKRDLALIFRAPLSEDQIQEKKTSYNQKKNESPNHEKAGQLITDGVLSIFPFGQQKSLLSQKIATLPTQHGPGEGRKPDHLDKGLLTRALNSTFKSPERICTRICTSLDLFGSHPNQHIHQGRGMIHV